MSSTYGGSTSLLVRAIPLLVAAVVGSAGVMTTLVASGIIEVPWLKKTEAEKAKAQPSGTPVLISARFIPAYTKVTRDHVLNDKTGELSVVFLPAAEVQRAEFLTLDKISGRVLKGDKASGYAFREKDFLPVGTHAGPSGGIPPGKRALVVPADRLAGVSTLQIGDHIDILMSMPTVPGNKSVDAVPSAPHPGQGAKLRRPGVVALAQDAVIVVPVTTRQTPVLTAVTGRDGKFTTKPVQEITIAVDPEETAALMQALAVDTELFCAVRSGQPGDPPGETPGLPAPPLPPPPIQIETIVGGKREIRTFPARP